MNFTREPIIETVITPREGCKLVVRSSKGVSQEDYYVDAVEVVSFGHSFFFRSQERPKSFLVPVSDYEVLELKETRMVLKTATTDRSIKIGGGREAPPRPREDEQQLAESRPPASPQQQQDGQPPLRGGDRKRDNKRRRGRRGRDRGDRPQEMRDPSREGEGSREEMQSPEELQQSEQQQAPGGEEKLPSFISKLFPPPPTLIKDSLSRYKPAEQEEAKPSLDDGLFDHPPTNEDENEE